MKVKTFEIDEKKIVVCDDLLTSNEFKKVLFLLQNVQLRRLGYSNSAEENTSHYIGYLEVHDVKSATFFKGIQETIQKHYGFENLECKRITYREMVFGDHFAYHYDSSTEGSVTALIYLNEDWGENYHGETLFRDSNDETGIFVLPRPGRVVLFDGRISHSSTPPARVLYKARKVLVFNFQRIS